MAVGKSTATPAKLKQSLETGRTTTEREMNIYAQARPRILVDDDGRSNSFPSSRGVSTCEEFQRAKE